MDHIKHLVSRWNDAEKATGLDAILEGNLGPEALAVQNKHITSCAREYVVHAYSKVLLFWRGPGVRYGETWHVSGTTRNKKKLEAEGLTPLASVREKYKLTDVGLNSPEFVEFVEVPHGDGPAECSFGEVWTELNCVLYLGGKIPENARWFPFDDLPAQTLPYHKTLLLPRVRSYLERH